MHRLVSVHHHDYRDLASMLITWNVVDMELGVIFIADSKGIVANRKRKGIRQISFKLESTCRQHGKINFCGQIPDNLCRRYCLILLCRIALYNYNAAKQHNYDSGGNSCSASPS